MSNTAKYEKTGWKFLNCNLSVLQTGKIKSLATTNMRVLQSYHIRVLKLSPPTSKVKQTL